MSGSSRIGGRLKSAPARQRFLRAVAGCSRLQLAWPQGARLVPNCSALRASPPGNPESIQRAQDPSSDRAAPLRVSRLPMLGLTRSLPLSTFAHALPCTLAVHLDLSSPSLGKLLSCSAEQLQITCASSPSRSKVTPMRPHSIVFELF